MYLDHFGLRDFPFRLAPDPAFMFWTADHHRAFDLLSRTLRDNIAVTMILGEPGTGKTTLLQHFISGLRRDACVGMIANYSSGLGGLDHWLHWAFDLRPEGPADELRTGIEDYLLARYHEGRSCLLIVDEAQNVSDDDLAALTDLTRLPAVPGVSMRLVLAGQPRLRRRLPLRPQGENAESSGLFQIGAMSTDDTQSYVRHRLAMSGCLNPVFDDEALQRIARLTGGVPRLVNVLCELLLTSAFGMSERRIDEAMLEHVLVEARQTGMIDLLLADADQVTPVSNMPTRRWLAMGISHAKQAPNAPVDSARSDAYEQDADSYCIAAIADCISAQPQTADSKTTSSAQSADSTILPFAARSLSHSRRVRLGLMTAGATAAAAIVATVLPGQLTRWTGESAAPGIALLHRTSTEPIAAATIAPALAAPSIVQGTDGSNLRDQALAAGQQDPLKAAIGYARAALRGDTRAAYYLGQHFETGDGVPRNTTLAAAWYAAAAETQRGARRALQNLTEATDLLPTSPPRPLLGTVDADSVAEFFWAAPDGAPARYLIELAKTPEMPPEQRGPFDLSAAMLDLTDSARLWRVVALDANGERIGTSPWHLIEADGIEAVASGPSQPLK